jgi:hypothetical protein
MKKAVKSKKRRNSKKKLINKMKKQTGGVIAKGFQQIIKYLLDENIPLPKQKDNL